MDHLRLVGLAAVSSALAMVASLVQAGESICYGAVGKGRLEGGVALPLKGNNFSSYSDFASVLDRNYVHSKVAETVLNAYKAVADAQPRLVFVYGESGQQHGGPFPPHRTHQNGLSVDFMVPVRDASGKSVPLPTQPWNKYGYGIEFDRSGRFGEYRIDFEAVALHLEALHRAARRGKIGIERIIFDPVYLPLLFATSRGDYLRANIPFMTRPAWIRHDEHYHVDFSLPCRPLR